MVPNSLVPIGPKNIVIHELIGLRIRVISHSDPTLVGVEGIVVDETLNTLVIETKDGERIAPKKFGVFCFQLPNGKWTVVKGEEILFRPVERTKKGYKKYLKRKPITFETADECSERYYKNL